jgi:hypothetical protein
MGSGDIDDIEDMDGIVATRGLYSPAVELEACELKLRSGARTTPGLESGEGTAGAFAYERGTAYAGKPP